MLYKHQLKLLKPQSSQQTSQLLIDELYLISVFKQLQAFINLLLKEKKEQMVRREGVSVCVWGGGGGGDLVYAGSMSHN